MNTNYIVGGLVAVIVILAGMLFFTGAKAPATETPDNGTTTVSTSTQGGTQTPTPNPSTQTPKFSQVKIALLDTTGSGSGKSRGCDTITMVTKSVPETTAPLGASLQALFAQAEGTAGSAQYNFIARTKSTLKFDKVTITNGTADIYLTGSLSGLAGVCDDPRAAIQLEETALQFASVQKVQLYLNNVATNLTPSQQ
jgi:hypothetical protein